jgi:hypothetical protein
MSRRQVISWLPGVAAALALAGCGATAGAQPSAHKPLASFPDLGYRYIAPHLPPGLSRDAVLVVDLTNTGRVAPASLRLASDTTLSSAHWSGWGAASTTGHGTATVLICSPDCGAGHYERYPATVVLSRIKACGSHRFYESGRVTLTTVKGPRPWGAVLKDPC